MTRRTAMYHFGPRNHSNFGRSKPEHAVMHSPSLKKQPSETTSPVAPEPRVVVVKAPEPELPQTPEPVYHQPLSVPPPLTRENSVLSEAPTLIHSDDSDDDEVSMPGTFGDEPLGAGAGSPLGPRTPQDTPMDLPLTADETKALIGAFPDPMDSYPVRDLHDDVQVPSIATPSVEDQPLLPIPAPAPAPVEKHEADVHHEHCRSHLDNLLAEANRINDDIELSSKKSAGLQDRVQAIRQAYDEDLKETTKVAASDMVSLMRTLDALFHLDQRREAMIARIRERSVEVAGRLEVLHFETARLVESSAELNADLNREKAQTEVWTGRVTQMLETAHQVREKYEDMQVREKENARAAQEAMAQARKSRAEAEHHKDKAQVGRFVRDVLTLGIGEITDWGHFNEKIKHADEIVASAEKSLKSAQRGLREATTRIEHVKKDLATFDTLEQKLTKESQSLHDMHDRSEQIRLKSASFIHKPLELSNFLAALAGETHALHVGDAACIFTETALSLVPYAEDHHRVSGLAVENPEVLKKTLGTVAVRPVGLHHH